MLEPLVEERDLLPVVRVLDVEIRDRCLEDVGPSSVESERACEQVPALVDPFPVPEGAVLVVEQDELAVTEAGGAARVVDEHEREQGVRIGLVRHQLDHGAA